MPTPRDRFQLVDSTPGWPPWVEQWVLPYAQDTNLRPVLVALLGHVVVVITPLMLAAYRVGSAGAIAVLVLLGLATVGLFVFEVVRFRRPGAVTAVLLATWVLSGLLAVIAERSGFL